MGYRASKGSQSEIRQDRKIKFKLLKEINKQHKCFGKNWTSKRFLTQERFYSFTHRLVKII